MRLANLVRPVEIAKQLVEWQRLQHLFSSAMFLYLIELWKPLVYLQQWDGSCDLPQQKNSQAVVRASLRLQLNHWGKHRCKNAQTLAVIEPHPKLCVWILRC